MSEKRYKIEFEVQGEYLADTIRLNIENIKELIFQDFESKGQGYYGNRDIDTHIENLKITKIKTKLPF